MIAIRNTEVTTGMIAMTGMMLTTGTQDPKIMTGTTATAAWKGKPSIRQSRERKFFI